MSTRCENIAEIAFEADVEFYLANGSSVPAVVSDIESIVNAMNVIYERDAEITHIIPRINVQIAEPDGLNATDSLVLIFQFRTKWINEHGSTSGDPILRDIAHLITGRFGGGRAFLGVICDDIDTGSGYGLSGYTEVLHFLNRVYTLAHELGHNWNADHCDGDGDCGIMCSSGPCTGPPDQFGGSARLAMIVFRNSRTCLDMGSPPAIDCNSNCIEDSQEILDGLSQDCNGNNIPDECDIASGLSGDCDVNGVPDICEDCNGNGIADVCELSTTYSDQSGPLRPFDFSFDAYYTIVSPPVALSDVTFEIDALGLFTLDTDNVEVQFDGFTIIGTIFDTSSGNGEDCPDLSGPDTITLTAADFNNRVAGGNATFRFSTTAFFETPFFGCSDSWISVDTSYTFANPNDVNGNGILDVCECDADCASGGADDQINVTDLLELLANWGPGSSCDIDPPGGDGTINVSDLLALLAAWGACP